MATQELVKETITVRRAGDFGPQIGNEYYGVNDPLTPDQFKAGQSYTVLVKRGKPTEKYPNGKAYISQIIGTEEKPQTSPVKTEDAPKKVAVDYEKKDAEKSKRILAQGVVQAVVGSPLIASLAANQEDAVKLVRLISRELIGFILEESK